jgi:phosphatidylglycerol:prolipoprotein diacylglycerol transferase
MKPILFHVGAVEIPAYLTMIMFGFFAAAIVARRDGEKAELDGVAMVDLCILMLVIGVVGARLLAVLTDGFLQDFVNLCSNSKLVDPIDTAVRFCTSDSQCGGEYLCDPLAQAAVVEGERKSMCYPPQDCLAVFKFWQGGLTFYGGVLLAAPTGFLYAKRRKLGALRAADLLAPALMIALAIGRIGCFLNGCCYGAQTDSGFGVLFPGHLAERHPTQLYESLFAFALFAVLRWVLRPRMGRDGQLFGTMLTLYGVFRICLEFVRDDPRGALGPLSTSQLIGLPLIATGLYLWFGRNGRTQREV